MARPSTTRIEMPWLLEGEHEVQIMGDVTLGGRWPVVRNFACVDPKRYDDELELPDAFLDDAEAALIAEAERIWRTP